MRPFPTLLVLLSASVATALAQPTTPETGGGRAGAMTSTRAAASGAFPAQQDAMLRTGRLPTPSVKENASPLAFLLAARGALAAGRIGETQEALERAETRLLDRSVPLFHTADPIHDPRVVRIERVLSALASGDRMLAMQRLERAIASMDAH